MRLSNLYHGPTTDMQVLPEVEIFVKNDYKMHIKSGVKPLELS